MYTSCRKLILNAIAFFGGLSAGAVNAATITNVGTTGVYDENISNINEVDVEHPSSTLATFKTSIANAFAANRGGVIDWSTGVTADESETATANNTLSTISAFFGASSTQTLNITFDRDILLYTNQISNQANTLSDTNAIIPGGGHDPIGLAFTMNFSGAEIGMIGAGMLSRNTYGDNGVDFQAIATFSGGGTETIDYTVGGFAGASDSFLYFEAPTGQSITSFKVTYIDDNGQALPNGERRPTMDDFGFAVIPEPSSAMLMLPILIAMGLRRHR